MDTQELILMWVIYLAIRPRIGNGENLLSGVLMIVIFITTVLSTLVKVF